MKTNIGKKLSKLINRHFPKHQIVSKIFNKNTIKLSHSCCGNIGSVIASHNRRIIHPITMDTIVEIELNTHLLMIVFALYANIAYKAPSKPDKKNFGDAETSFEDRFRNHTRDFCHKKYVNGTELSKCMWKLKDEKITPSIKWNIKSIVHGTP